MIRNTKSKGKHFDSTKPNRIYFRRFSSCVPFIRRWRNKYSIRWHRRPIEPKYIGGWWNRKGWPKGLVIDSISWPLRRHKYTHTLVGWLSGVLFSNYLFIPFFLRCFFFLLYSAVRLCVKDSINDRMLVAFVFYILEWCVVVRNGGVFHCIFVRVIVVVVVVILSDISEYQ